MHRQTTHSSNDQHTIISDTNTVNTPCAHTNATASGPHLPHCDWGQMDYGRRTHKGMRLDDGRWGPDTSAVDHLIGSWNADLRRRVDGCGFHAAVELAWAADPSMSIVPTVNEGIDAGGGLHIDWLLANDKMRPHLVPDSYRVHLPRAGQPYPSDHRLVTVSLDL